MNFVFKQLGFDDGGDGESQSNEAAAKSKPHCETDLWLLLALALAVNGRDAIDTGCSGEDGRLLEPASLEAPSRKRTLH